VAVLGHVLAEPPAEHGQVTHLTHTHRNLLTVLDASTVNSVDACQMAQRIPGMTLTHRGIYEAEGQPPQPCLA
jgi:hypothetical protein